MNPLLRGEKLRLRRGKGWLKVNDRDVSSGLLRADTGLRLCESSTQ